MSRRWNHKSSISKRDKLKAIQSFLSGAPVHTQPQSYTVMSFKEDQYQITRTSNGQRVGSVMTEAEFELWKTTLHQLDELHIVLFRSQTREAPIVDTKPKEPKRKPVIKQLIEEPTQESKPVEEPIKDAEETILFAMPKRAGKLSEYGDTWRVKNREYNMN